MPLTRIYADFHNLDDSNRLRLTCAGTWEDFSRQGIELREGLHLTFAMDDANDSGLADDLIADGVTHFDQEQQCWMASVDWTTLRHASEDKIESAPPTLGSAAGGRTVKWPQISEPVQGEK